MGQSQKMAHGAEEQATLTGAALTSIVESIGRLNNPPAKAGGFELRTESPDTRRLNDASYSGSILKLSPDLGSK